MDGRDWKNLNTDCIVEIFSRVEKDSLVFHIPLVCKWWYRASLDPMCWRNLIFPESDVYEPQPNPSMLRIRDQRHRSRFTAFIKFVVYRSQRCGSTFHVPTYFSDEEFEYLSIRCPGLKILNSSIIPNHGPLISKAIRNWKHLEVLSLKDHHMFYEILSQISIYCERFVELNCSSFNFGKTQASAVVDALPNIRKLSIKDCYLPRKSLVMILKGCKGLKVLDVCNCWGIIEDDQIQILHLASYIRTFKFKLCPMVPLPSRDVLWNEDFDPKQNQSEEKFQHGSDINSSELQNSKIKNFRKRSRSNTDGFENSENSDSLIDSEQHPIQKFQNIRIDLVPVPSRDVLWNEGFDPKQNQSEEKFQHGSDINSSELRNSKIKNFRKRSRSNIDGFENSENSDSLIDSEQHPIQKFRNIRIDFESYI